MQLVVPIAGVMSALLGGLWLLRGLGVVVIPPILCVANCEVIEGGSTTWTVVGFLVVGAGVIAILHTLKRMRQRYCQANDFASLSTAMIWRTSSSSWLSGTMLGPSDGAWSGSWWVSMNTAATPTAAAARGHFPSASQWGQTTAVEDFPL